MFKSQASLIKDFIEYSPVMFGKPSLLHDLKLFKGNHILAYKTLIEKDEDYFNSFELNDHPYMFYNNNFDIEHYFPAITFDFFTEVLGLQDNVTCSVSIDFYNTFGRRNDWYIFKRLDRHQITYIEPINSERIGGILINEDLYNEILLDAKKRIFDYKITGEIRK